MTDPYKMNCSHSPDGWCLPCVAALSAELVDAQSQVEAHQRRYHECEEFYQVRLTEAECNAARYRWLRLAPQTLDACGIVGDELDTAIDKLRTTDSAAGRENVTS